MQGVAQKAGDRCWPMPLYDEYFDQIRSEIADIVNSGGRAGGACTAAMFLKQGRVFLLFAEEVVIGTLVAMRSRAYADLSDRYAHAAPAPIDAP